MQTWRLVDLAREVDLPPAVVQKRMLLWVNQGVVSESSPGPMYRLVKDQVWLWVLVLGSPRTGPCQRCFFLVEMTREVPVSQSQCFRVITYMEAFIGPPYIPIIWYPHVHRRPVTRRSVSSTVELLSSSEIDKMWRCLCARTRFFFARKPTGRRRRMC